LDRRDTAPAPPFSTAVNRGPPQGGSSRLSGDFWTAHPACSPPIASRAAITPLARFSLLLVALLVSGFSLGLAPARADGLPEDTNKIESLTPEQARKLAEEFPGVDVEIEIKGYGKQKKRACLPMNGLKSLDAETAKALAGYGNGPLLLNGLTALDADTAKALAESKAWDGRLLNLTTLDADAAKALADFKGQSLSLNGLTTLDAEAAKALACSKAWHGRLPNLTTLDANTAKALAAADKWDGLLPSLTALDTADSVAVAQALATRKGPLSLPNLKKISPKTLAALIQKKDVEIPLIETLELIQEPDGSTDDFVIPEWLEERQKQQRAEQAAE
jgi:hypothetical protein